MHGCHAPVQAADEAQTRKQSRSKQRRSKSTSSESKSGSFKPITELDESRMKAPQTPQSSKRPRPSRTSFPVKPKKRRPSDIALLAGSSTAKHIPRCVACVGRGGRCARPRLALCTAQARRRLAKALAPLLAEVEPPPPPPPPPPALPRRRCAGGYHSNMVLCVG